MECSVVGAGESRTGPGMATQVKRVLMTLRFVLVLEPVMTELTHVLLFRLMVPTKQVLVSDRAGVARRGKAVG